MSLDSICNVYGGVVLFAVKFRYHLMISCSAARGGVNTCVVFRENRWKKRGLAILPTKFGICNGTLTAMCQVFTLLYGTFSFLCSDLLTLSIYL